MMARLREETKEKSLEKLGGAGIKSMSLRNEIWRFGHLTKT